MESNRRHFTGPWCPFHKHFYHHNSDLMKISFCSYQRCSEVIAMKFCTCHDNTAVMACAKCCSDIVPYNAQVIVARNLLGQRTAPCGWKVTGGTPLVPGAHFTNTFIIVLQIWWKFHSALIKGVVKWSLWNFAHGIDMMKAVLSWHVQNFIPKYYLMTELHENQFSIELGKLFMKWAPDFLL